MNLKTLDKDQLRSLKAELMIVKDFLTTQQIKGDTEYMANILGEYGVFNLDNGRPFRKEVKIAIANVIQHRLRDITKEMQDRGFTPRTVVTPSADPNKTIYYNNHK